ncbi:MAG: UDP-N-acetylmuramoyl-tripeptide--D-alanyl-D-alanine ligase [candidate division WOR-3 bacterium]
MRLSELAKILNGCLRGYDVEFAGVSTDSRDIDIGDLFVAIKGLRFDGHDFVEDALNRGAVASLVEKPVKGNYVLVDDTVNALLRWARYKRERFKGEVIGVLGAVGKTTTKGMLAHTLKEFYKITYSPKSFNNFVGLSITITKASVDEDLWVLELGTNRPGEIKKLAKSSIPNHVIFTRLGPEHIEGFGSTLNAIREEYSVLEYVDGLVLIHSEAPIFPEGRFYTYGFSEGDFVGKNLNISEDGVRFNFEGVEFFVPYPHFGFAENALAVASFSKLFGLPLKEVSDILREYRGEPMRMERLKCGDLLVINDAYNSNPLSVDMLLKSVYHIYPDKKIFFAFGDMLELGSESEYWHRWVGKKMCLYGISAVAGYGGFSGFVLDEAKNCGIKTFYAKSHEDIAEYILAGDWDIVIVKGSRGMEMERVVKILCSRNT